MTAPTRAVPSAGLSDADLFGVYQLCQAGHLAIAPDDPFPAAAEWLASVRQQPSTITLLHWIAARGQGHATLFAYAGGTNAELHVCVATEARRQGIGRALLELVMADARDHGFARLSGWHGDPTGAAFASAVGAQPGRSRHRSVLRLRAAADTLRATDADADTVAGYTTTTWVGAAPEELLASYARARNAIDDAPHTLDLNRTPTTPELVREEETLAASRGVPARVTAALDADGAVVGSTELTVPDAPGAVAHTLSTSVLAEHRGRRLARMVKREALRRLAADRPDVETVVTSNDSENTAMLAVNTGLGFRIAATWTDAIIEV